MEKGPRWLKLEFLAYQRVSLLRGREMCNLLMHASIPSIHFSSLSLGFCIFHFLLCFLYFLFFLSISLFYFYFYLLFIIFAIVPLPFSLFTTIAFYNACCDKIFPFLPLNHFWLIVGILPRLLTGLLAI